MQFDTAGPRQSLSILPPIRGTSIQSCWSAKWRGRPVEAHSPRLSSWWISTVSAPTTIQFCPAAGSTGFRSLQTPLNLSANYKGRPAGSLGDIAVVSFNGNKIITCGGGGMLLSNEQEYVDRARFLATQARDEEPHYEHSTLGYNYRLSNLLAAVGRAQLRVLEERVAARRRNRELYEAHLADTPGLDFAPVASYGGGNAWLTCILIDDAKFGVGPAAVRELLAAQEIEARPLWKPMHRPPIFRDYRCVGGATSDDLFARGLCLPSGSSLSEGDVERVVEALLGCRS